MFPGHEQESSWYTNAPIHMYNAGRKFEKVSRGKAVITRTLSERIVASRFRWVVSGDCLPLLAGGHCPVAEAPPLPVRVLHDTGLRADEGVNWAHAVLLLLG